MRHLLLLLLCFPLIAFADGIEGTWGYVSVTRDAHSDTEETQRTLRTFQKDGTLIETICYDERALSASGEAYVLHYRATLKGTWQLSDSTLFLNYKARSLQVYYDGISFPERDQAVQKILEKEMEDSLGDAIYVQSSVMQTALRRYYATTPNRRLNEVAIENDLLFVRTTEGRRAFQRVNP